MNAQTDVPTSYQAILEWCQEYVAKILGVSAESLDTTMDFDKLGLDSALAVSLLIEIEERFGLDVPPEALFENATLEATAGYLHNRLHNEVA